MIDIPSANMAPSLDHPPVELLHRLVQTKAVDAEVAAWLRFGFRRWLYRDDDLPPLVNFGLPSTPQRVRVGMRDYWLRQAAASLRGDTPWRRARALAEEVAQFQRFKQSAWRNMPAPPPYAAPIEVLLHAAVQAWPEIPNTPQALRNILEAE